MQSGQFATSDVVGLTSTIEVNGVERKHVSWSIQRELAGDLPDQVVGGSGIKQAHGTIVWAEGEDVADKAVNPWNSSTGWLPKTGDRVVIQVSDGVRTWPQFMGVIDDTEGEVGGSPQSTVIDYTDYLIRPFRHSAVLRIHPPKVEGGSFLGVGLTPAYAVDRLFRAAGFYPTPRLEPGVVMSAPLQTSTWPEYGILTAAGSASGVGSHGNNSQAPWGWCMRDFTATYAPQGAAISRADPVQLTAMAAPDHAGSFTLDANYGSGRIRLWITDYRAAVAMLDGVEVCRLSLGAGTIVSLLVKGSSWTLKSDAGGTASGSKMVPGGEALSSVSIAGDEGSRIAGIQVSKPTALSEFQSIGHKANAFQDSSSLLGIQDAMPSMVGRTVAEVLDEISQATLSPYWFREDGRLVMYGSDVLRGRSSMQTVTTLDDITKLSWSDSRLSVRSSVTVKYRYPALNRSRYSNILLWEGSGETMDSGQEKELFAKEPSDEDWVEADDFTVSTAGGMDAFNTGRGTWVTSYMENSKGEPTASTGYVTWSPIRKIDEETWLFKVAAGSLPAGHQLVLGTPKEASNYSPRMRGVNMPIMRGRGRVQWADMSLMSATTGPAGFPALEHDIGSWSVRTDNTLIQTRIADYIASQVTTPSPTISGMHVTYDPRRQLGDVLTVQSPNLMGMELRVLVVGINNSAGDTFSQSLTVRIISAKSTYVSYDELAAVWAGGNYESLNTAWAALNYSAFDANPLEVTP